MRGCGEQIHRRGGELEICGILLWSWLHSYFLQIYLFLYTTLNKSIYSGMSFNLKARITCSTITTTAIQRKGYRNWVHDIQQWVRPSQKVARTLDQTRLQLRVKREQFFFFFCCTVSFSQNVLIIIEAVLTPRHVENILCDWFNFKTSTYLKRKS